MKNKNPALLVSAEFGKNDSITRGDVACSQRFPDWEARNVMSLATFLDTACSRFNGVIERRQPEKR